MPLFWLGLSVIGGVLMAARTSLPTLFWVGLLLCALLSTALEYCFCSRNRHPLLSIKLVGVACGLLLVAFAAGGWRFQAVLPIWTESELNHHHPPGETVVLGRVISYPRRSQQGLSAKVKVSQLAYERKTFPVDGLLELWLPSSFHLAYGDQVRLTGELKPVQEEGESPLDSRAAIQGVASLMKYPQVKTIARGQGSLLLAAIYSLREKAQRLIYRLMPFPESALLTGILLGIDWNIPTFLLDAYRAAGIVHIIAISGFNIAIIANLITRLFRKVLPLYWDGILAVAAICLYTLLVGAEPAVTRAAIMGVTAIPAWYIGRRVIGINTLTVTASIMLLFNPLLLWDISFQLSFLATLGLMTLVDPLVARIRHFLEKHASERTTITLIPVITLVIATLAAQFAVSPVILRLQPTVQLLALPANFIILPLQPLLMGFGGLSVIIGFIVPELGGLFARIAWLLAALCNRVAVFFSLHPFAEFPLPVESAVMMQAVVLLVLGYASIHQIHGLHNPSLETFNSPGSG